jgi:hypothetical protein
MLRLSTLVSLFIAAILCGSLFAASTLPTIQSLNKIPLSFTKNMGQWDNRVLFRANSGGATMWFTKEGVTYQFTRRVGNDNTPLNPLSRGDLTTATTAKPDEPIPLLRGARGVSDRDSIEQLVLTAKFVGANPNPEVIAEAEMEYKCNYFIGNDPSKWHTDVPNYEAITLKDLYPGIDLRYSGRRDNGQAAYEFIAAPGADIAQIKVAYEGAEETSLDSNGRLILKTKWGDMTAGIGSGVNGTGLAFLRFALNSENTPDNTTGGQSLGQKSSGTLTLGYSTYLGGSSAEWGRGIAVDGSDCAYLTGYTASSDFPTQDAYDLGYHGGYDAFVTKLSAAGNSLVYSTYLGSSSDDFGLGIAVDVSGCAYVTGYTSTGYASSSNFPVRNAFDTSPNGWDDVFVTKVSAAGNSLVYSTFLGGYSYDQATDIAVDGTGCAYVTGITQSRNFPTENAYDASFNGDAYDAFVTKLSSGGNSLVYSTFLGGSSCIFPGANSYNSVTSIAVDDSGYAYVTGYTNSTDFPTQNAYDASYNGDWEDVFVTKLSAVGSSLVYSTFLGGSRSEIGLGIAVDRFGCTYVTGCTGSSDFPTLNPYQTYQGGNDAFVAKLSSTGNSLLYSTYVGGGGPDDGWGIAVDGNCNAYVTGYTQSSDFPTVNPYQRTLRGGQNALVTKLSNSGDSLIYCTYFGGADWDVGNGIAVDNRGNAYLTGDTESPDFPTSNPYQTDQGGWDAFVTKLVWTPAYPCGDVNTDEQVNVLDIVFLINYIFVGGPAPQQLSLADVDCSGSINIGDVVLMINYIFRGGPAPCDGCK